MTYVNTYHKVASFTSGFKHISCLMADGSNGSEELSEPGGMAMHSRGVAE
jgi:hypothetical protein